MKAKHYLLWLYYFLFATPYLSYCQEILTDLNGESPSKSIGFVSNIGQIMTTDGDTIPSILFHSIQTTPQEFFF